MKKTISIIFSVCFITSFISCKKAYTCQCNTAWTYKTNSNSFNTAFFNGDKTPYSEKMTKKQAQSACDNQGITTEKDITNGLTDNGYYPLLSGESVKTDCELIVK